MTLLKRDVHERMNNADRGISIAEPLSQTELSSIASRVSARVKTIYNVDIKISFDEIRRVYANHVNRITKVIVGKTLKDMAIERTYVDILEQEIGSISQRTYQSSLSYPESIKTTQMSNTNLINGTIRSKRSVAGVSGGVRLF